MASDIIDRYFSFLYKGNGAVSGAGAHENYYRNIRDNVEDIDASITRLINSGKLKGIRELISPGYKVMLT